MLSYVCDHLPFKGRQTVIFLLQTLAVSLAKDKDTISSSLSSLFVKEKDLAK